MILFQVLVPGTAARALSKPDTAFDRPLRA
jgi:hypothetical protein